MMLWRHSGFNMYYGSNLKNTGVIPDSKQFLKADSLCYGYIDFLRAKNIDIGHFLWGKNIFKSYHCSRLAYPDPKFNPVYG